MASSKDQVLLGAFAAIESAHFYSAFLPSVMTIKKFADGDADRAALRQGEAFATGFALLLGWVVSELVDSYLPLLFSAGTAGLMLIVYETAIQGQMNGAVAKNAVGTIAGQFWPMGYQPS
jgi:hypothetical protein